MGYKNNQRSLITWLVALLWLIPMLAGAWEHTVGEAPTQRQLSDGNHICYIMDVLPSVKSADVDGDYCHEYRAYVSVGGDEGEMPLMVNMEDYISHDEGYALRESDCKAEETVTQTPASQRESAAHYYYLLLKVTPPNAEVSIDGVARQLNAEGEGSVYLSKGSHTYSVAAAGYATRTGAVELNERTILEISLEPTMADLVVSVSPVSATLLIDGVARTLADGAATFNLPLGSHTYRISAAGYATQMGTVELNGRATLTIGLESTMATLTLSCDTRGATFYVNDQKRGTDTWTGDLLADTYRIEARKEGYRTESRTVTLSELEERTESFPALTPIIGSLNVNYMPIDTEVWIDGEKAGVSPDMLCVMVGSHRVELRKEGYVSRSEQVSITEGEETLIEGDLAKGNESINGHESVDLGLSVRWATCNVGATSPGHCGDYYAWGETETKSKYAEKNSKTCGKDVGDIGGTKRDVAHAVWGAPWRMPTKEEIDELINECTWTWTMEGGHAGYEVTGKNGNSIFLPAAGVLEGTSLRRVGDGGHYWSGTHCEGSTQKAYGLGFYGGSRYTGWGYRYDGIVVRPVAE